MAAPTLNKSAEFVNPEAPPRKGIGRWIREHLVIFFAIIALIYMFAPIVVVVIFIVLIEVVLVVDLLFVGCDHS